MRRVHELGLFGGEEQEEQEGPASVGVLPNPRHALHTLGLTRHALS